MHGEQLHHSPVAAALPATEEIGYPVSQSNFSIKYFEMCDF